MREILFRGQTKEGNWKQGFLVNLSDEEHGDCWAIIPPDVESYRFNMSGDYIIPSTIGQFTGLTDKNGKRIFEGDIVKGLFLFQMSVNAVVAFRYGAFGLEWHRGSVKTFSAFTSICNVVYEVIGNIHDNPDLMKGE